MISGCMEAQAVNGTRLLITPPEATIALTLAFYALHDTLVSEGVVPAGAVAQNLRRYRADDLKLAGFLEALILQLDEMPFRHVSVREKFKVIDGDG